MYYFDRPTEHTQMPQSAKFDPTAGRQIVEQEVLDLHFDPENPRLPRSIDSSDESCVLKWMLDDASLADLIGSIASQGYFRGEPLLVVPRKMGGLTVVEGNRRLAALKLLKDPDLAPVRKRTVAELVSTATHKPTVVPTVEFAERDEILQYLGYRHITGVKEWEPLAKARYVRQLWARTKSTSAEAKLRKLAQTIGSGKRADYVGRLLAALALYEQVEDENFFDISGLSEDSVKFSFFLVALNHSAIVRFLGLRNTQDPLLPGLKKKHLRELVDWMFRVRADGETVLGESRNIVRLGRVVENEIALAALRKGEPLSVAESLTGAPEEVFFGEIKESRDHLLTAQSQQHLVGAVRSVTRQHLQEIQKLTVALLRVIGDLPLKDE